ncbi:Z1 domain-containing protein [Daejeonella oryzae]|uniref:Z1 domain-containing protein n=1 Tax=Daejeonella oryzae TaxID=1122943 RepID=UPI0004067F3A|nr:Z1 domain-containing protein [Daejeonella oryzae]
MTNSECIEIIKSFIKEKAKEREHILHSFFEDIKIEITNIRSFFPGLSALDEVTFLHLYNVAAKEFQSVNPIEIDPSTSLTKKDFKTWLTEDRKKQLQYDYINRYLTYLSKRGRSEKVVDEIKISSEKILSKLGDPKSERPFYVKGLVVGSVQSGKTGNFNAVINRAIDSGYSLIIVLSGIMEDLRSQTQMRIEEDVIGEGSLDISKDNKGDKGVGSVRKFGEQGDQSVRQVFSITSYKSDFKKSVKDTDFSLNNKNILVCKKNTGVLKNLLIWLSDYLNENKEKHDIPFLIVDDEADNASLNNLGKKGVDYASKINGHIRALLNLFTRKTYLGYTATPFANVLQDRNGLSALRWPVSYRLNGQTVDKDFGQVNNIFPDDFIELLNPPSNYIGAKQIFETVLNDALKIPLVEIVNDAIAEFPSHTLKDDGTERATVRNDNFPVKLPRSLEEATQCFVLSIALRLSRIADMTDSGFLNPHHTMLVHISRFIPWQNKTKDLLGIYIQKLEEDINNDLPNNKKLIYGTLEKTWNRYYATIVQNIRAYLPEGYSDEFLVSKTFSEVKGHLIDAVKGIEIKAVNSETGDKLQYVKDSSGNGKKIIAVGGNRLSRGFTLEGLTINYFIRNTNYSDTLLQMGRWFGYRPGYLDCCKVFTTFDAVQKFDSTTRAIEELEAEFIKLKRLNKTPQDFVLRVRKHPGTLKITRPSILKNTKVVNWSYQDQLVQSTRFKVNDADRINQSWEAFRAFINTHHSQITYDDRFFRLDLSFIQLIEFLNLPNTFTEFEIPSIIRFIELCAEKNKLKNWTIAIKANGEGGTLNANQTGLTVNLGLSVRSGPKPESATYFREQFITRGIFSASGKSANIVSSGSDFDLLLSDEVKRKAIADFRLERSEYFRGKDIPDFAQKALNVTIPEKVYREIMPDDHGLLVVYLMDLKAIFREEMQDSEMDNMVIKNGIKTDIPLIGYAIGFPPISPDPGGEYVHGDYDLDDEEGEDEWDEILETNED